MKHCKVENCERVVYCKDLCQGHYYQLYSGREISEISKRLNHEERKEVIKMHDEGTPIIDIAEKFEVTKGTIYRIIRLAIREQKDEPTKYQKMALQAKHEDLQNRFDALKRESGVINEKNVNLTLKIKQMQKEIEEKDKEIERLKELKTSSNVKNLENELRDVVGERDLYKEGNDRLMRILKANMIEI